MSGCHFPPCEPLVEHVVTVQEYRIAELSAKGLSGKVIAQRLKITIGSFRVYKSHLHSKLGLSAMPGNSLVNLVLMFQRGEIRTRRPDDPNYRRPATRLS